MKHKFWVKVMVWVLAVLMIGSCAGVLFSSLFSGAFTASAAEVEPEYVTVGLMYGSDVTVGFETVSTVGFSVHAVTSTRTERSYEEIFTVELPKISVVCDDNLSKTAYTYSIYDGSKACVVGGYHIETADSLETREDAELMLELIKAGLREEGSIMHPFIAYIDGAYKVRIGDYASEKKMNEMLATIPVLASEIDLIIVPPSKTGVMIVDPETNVIHFEFDDGGDRWMGLTALPKDGEKQYLKTPANRLYDGVFLYERYRSGSTDGVALSNMLPLEDYIAGVVPYEISPRWPEEALRAFSITVRGYTVKNKNRHYSTYGFDICNTTHCQVYRGIADANDAVFEAVKSTEGLVLCYGDAIVPTYYSSSTGGYTASAKDTWGGSDAPYLEPIYTPWERYSEHGNGLWVSKVSGSELADYLRSKGYTKITGKSITDIKINECSGDGPYVYSITYTDSDGNALTVERCDRVRTSLSKYLNSANFVVGKGSLTYSYDEVVSIDMESTFSFTTGNYTGMGEGRKVLTADGLADSGGSRVNVQTADGIVSSSADALKVANAESCYYADVENAPGIILRRVTKTETADDDTFIFAGKGWGHGVGISQYGTYDLANAGATAEEILSLYFPTLEIRDYRELQKEIKE